MVRIRLLCDLSTLIYDYNRWDRHLSEAYRHVLWALAMREQQAFALLSDIC